MGFVVVEGFSKEANSASKSLSGEAFFFGVSLNGIDAGAGGCAVVGGADSVAGAAVESDDHHQPMT